MPINGLRKHLRWLLLSLVLVSVLHLLMLVGLVGGWFEWPGDETRPDETVVSVRILPPELPTPPAPPPPVQPPEAVLPEPPPPSPEQPQPAPPRPAPEGLPDQGLPADGLDAVVPGLAAQTEPGSSSRRSAAEELPKAGRLAVEAFWGEYALGEEPLGRGEIEIAFPADDRYAIRLTARAVRWLSVFVTGEVSFMSEGRLTEAGLVPERFAQNTPRRGPSESRFDGDRGKARLKPDGPEIDMPPGVQDRLSVVFHLALWARSQPDGLQFGEALEVPLAGTSEVRQLRFTVGDREDLVLPGGILVSAHRISSDPFEFKRQGQIEMWLDPADRFLPARILYREPSGRALDFLVIRPVF